MPKKIVFASVGGLLVLTIGLFIGLKLASEPQLLENKAASSGGSATLKLVPQSSTLTAGSDTTIEAKLNTGSSQILIYQAVIDFTYTDAAPPIQITGTTVTPAEPALNCITNQVNHDTSAKKYTMVVSCAVPLASPPVPYTTNSTDKTMFTFNLHAVSDGTLSYTFDNNNTKVNANDVNATDILDIPQNGSYMVGSGSLPTNTPMPSNTQVPNQPTNTQAPSPTPTPTTVPGNNTGATNACGGTCGSNNNCNAGLVCSAGFCRNPSCTGESSCNCPGATATPTVRPTARPTTVVATPTPTTKIVNYVEPTIVSDNPFLGGTPRADVDVPDINYQDNTPVAKPNFFVTLFQWIIKFLRSLFGFR